MELRFAGLYPQCEGDQITSATIRWRLRRLPTQQQTVAMDGGPEEFVGLSLRAANYRAATGLSVLTVIRKEKRKEPLFQPRPREVPTGS